MSEPGPPQSSIRDGVRAGMPFAFASFALSISFGVVAQPGVGDPVEGGVEVAVAGAVEPVADGAAGGGLEGADAGEAGEGGFGAQAAGVGEGDQ